MISSTFVATMVVFTLGVAVPAFAMMQGVEFMFDTMRNKQRPIRTIKFKDFHKA